MNRGGGPRTNSAEALSKLTSLKSDLDSLMKQEACLDEQIRIMEMNKSIVIEDENNKKFEFKNLILINFY